MSTSLDVNCPIVIDGDLLELKFETASGHVVEETILGEYECLKNEKSEAIQHILNDMKLMKIIE